MIEREMDDYYMMMHIKKLITSIERDKQLYIKK